MSEQAPESTPDTPAVNVEAEQAVVNNAPDGGGVDNNAPAESGGNEGGGDSGGDSAE